MLAIKELLDSSRAAGQLILTGSSNFLRTPALSESLAGRIDLLTFWPLSVGELSAGADGVADRAFSGVDHLLGHDGATPPRSEYLDLVCRGGYREVQRLSPRSRRRWFERYVETVLRREVETAADLRRFDAPARRSCTDRRSTCVGFEGGRSPGGGPASRVPGHEGLVAAKPDLHGVICSGLA